MVFVCLVVEFLFVCLLASSSWNGPFEMVGNSILKSQQKQVAARWKEKKIEFGSSHSMSTN